MLGENAGIYAVKFLIDRVGFAFAETHYSSLIPKHCRTAAESIVNLTLKAQF